MTIELPEIFRFEGAQPGPRLTILGAVHGNETCGPKALNRILSALEAGQITIERGVLTLVPICNPRAYTQNVRFTERNLNRFMFPKDEPQAYEDHLDNALCPILDDTDYLLDIHSYTAQGDAFIFNEETDAKSINFVKALGVPRVISGWTAAVEQNEDVVDKKQAMGTTEYAAEQGAVAVTLECGTHDHPRGADVAFQSSLNAIRYLELGHVPQDLDITDLPNEGTYVINIQACALKTRSGDYTQDWQNMDRAAAGTVIARYDDGEELVMPKDGFIVLPKRDTAIGHEWFFWGVEGTL